MGAQYVKGLFYRVLERSALAKTLPNPDAKVRRRDCGLRMVAKIIFFAEAVAVRIENWMGTAN